MFPFGKSACALRGLVFLSLAGHSALGSETLELRAIADTTLIQGSPNNNLGAATFFNAGSNGGGSRNRALMLFNLAGIPANATITGVELSLVVIRQPTENPTPS